MGLKKMGHPTILEKMIFWGKYGLDQGSEAVCKVSEGWTTAKMNEINQEKQLFYFHLFPLKGVVHS